MANRLDALMARESNGKTYFSKIGVAFENKNGDGWNVLLDSMPAPQDGQFKFMLKPPMEKDNQGDSPKQNRGGNRQSGGASDGIEF